MIVQVGKETKIPSEREIGKLGNWEMILENKEIGE